MPPVPFTRPTLSSFWRLFRGLALLFLVTVGVSAQTVPVSGGAGGHGGNGSGGGNGRGGGDGSGPQVTPVITAQPISRTVVEGAGVTFEVTVTGKFPIYQWFKNGVVIAGAQSPTLTLEKTAQNDAAKYTVSISNNDGSVTSSAAVLTVTPAFKPEAPAIVTQPVAQLVDFDGSTTLTVVASGTGPLSYQWQKDGVALTGATSASLNVTNATVSASYRVVVTNVAGSVTSGSATLTVRPTPVEGAYFGSFGGGGGAVALIIRTDRTGVFLGFANASRQALISRDVVVVGDGSFVAVLEGGERVEGAVAPDGTLKGTVSGLNLAFTAPAAARTGAAAAVSGFFPTRMVGGSAQGYAIVGAKGDVLLVNITGTTADGGVGTVSADGLVALSTAANARVVGTISAATSILSATVTPVNGAAATFVGSSDVRSDFDKLINISTRSLTGTAANNLIAGFVIAATQPKPVLVRAIGPTLATFGVGGVLSAARLEVFRGATSVAVGNDWGTPVAGGASAEAIAAASARVGAFPLANASRDAALLLNLEPGAYTAVVTGQGGVSGVSMVEVYDATVGEIPRDQRIVNTATRATAGTGDGALITGFFITGNVPKRVLLRGTGPGLTQFGVTGALARPTLTVSSGTNVLASNSGWSGSPDAAAITSGSAQAGAFALTAGSQDAALIINLAPGAYTAQVSGVGNTTGVALVELYELP